jgi:hypothetical protein
VSERPRKPAATPTGGIPAIEPEQVAAFAAFRRLAADTDRALCADADWLGRLGDAQAGHHINPSLARRVYEGSKGSIYLVPGGGAICYIAAAASGETVIGTTTTEVAAQAGLGSVRGGRNTARTFVGVLPYGGHDLQIVDRTVGPLALPLSPDDGYWITVADPLDMFWTRRDGTVHHAPAHLFTPRRAP